MKAIYNLVISCGFIMTVKYTVSAQPGALDLTFGNAGITTTDCGGADYVRAVAIQGDGKIVVAGTGFPNSSWDFALVRFNADGTLDNSFDSDGKVITDINFADWGYAVAIQSDGKIVMAGFSDNGTDNDFTLVRYNPDGALDNTFSSDGKVTTAIGSNDDNGKAVAIQGDGKILVAGISYNTSNNFDFALVRYNSDGTLDNTFSSDGKLTTPIGIAGDLCHTVAIQSDGKIVAAGQSDNGSDWDFALVRYNTDGSLDNTFDSDGIVTTTVGSSEDKAYSVALQSNGKIVAAGMSTNGTYDDFTIARYNSDGTPDNTFDSDGKTITTVGSLNDWGYAAVIQSDGKIVVAGMSEAPAPADDLFALVRYNTDGTPDNTFDADGIVTTDIGSSDDVGYAVALQSDGKIVVAGISDSSGDWNFAVARYNGGGGTGINDGVNKNTEIMIFPNPLLMQTTLQVNNLLKNANLSVYNSLGQSVRQLNNLTGKAITFRRDNLPAGLYYLRLTQDGSLMAAGQLAVTD